MPTKDHHVVLRFRIEVTIDKHGQNSMLQYTVHKAIQQRIIPILSRLFSEYVPQDVVIHLDKLVIDAGHVHLSNLGKQLHCQVEQVLTVQLKETIKKVIGNPKLDQVMPLPDAKRQAIAHYLSEGHFAWWMTERSEKQIEKLYLALLHDTPLQIEQLWSSLNKKEKAVQRCMAIFSSTTIVYTLACLLKQPVAFFKPILDETELLLHQTNILKNRLYTPEQQLLSMTLLGAIHEQKHKVNRIDFLSMLLKQVAIQTSISYETILGKLQMYYAQNQKKSLVDQTTKALVFQLHDLVVTPPKIWHKDLKSQEKVLTELDKIGNNSIAFHQLPATISGMKTVMHNPNIRFLVKSWLQETNNREKLVKNLPDRLFVPFLASIDPSIVAICSDCIQIATATAVTTAPAWAIKAITLAYSAFEYGKTFYLQEIQSLFRKYIANRTIAKKRLVALLTTHAYHPAVKAIMGPLVSIATPPSNTSQITQDGMIHPHLGSPPNGDDLLDRSAHQSVIQPSVVQRVEALVMALLQATPCQVEMDAVNNILLTAAMAGSPITEKQYIKRVVAYLTPYMPFSADILCTKLSNIAQQVKDPGLAECFAGLATKTYRTTYLDKNSTSENPLADVVDFLLYNELPKDQLVPAYVIAKHLAHATPDQIRDQLAPLCQEASILRKLIQHATEATLAKLFQAFIPFPGALLNRLEKVIIASKVLQNSQQKANTASMKAIFIAAAVMHTPPTTSQAYIARILLHLSKAVACGPIILSDQLIDAANQSADNHLVAAFSLLKEQLKPLHLHTIDEVDLMFLSTDKILNKSLLPLYYSKLLPVIKDRIEKAVWLSQAAIDRLVAQELPNISKPLQEMIGIALYKQVSQTVKSKKKQVAQRWHLFLHTGRLGNYADGTALLNDVITHLPSFSLAQDTTHVRQRLIANFNHRQLMLLVQRHSKVGKTLENFIEGSYQLWCATHGLLSRQSSTKNLFWDSVLKTLPKASIAKDDWLAQITTEWSNLLKITPTTLLATFQCLDTMGVPEALTDSLHLLQKKYQKRIQEQAIQSGYKIPVLTKLYLLLNGNLFLFDQQYHTDMPILGKQLIQFITDQPLVLSKFLEEQKHHQLVARRMVYYLGQEVATKVITCLAKDKAEFINNYFNLLNDSLQHSAIPFHDFSIWKNELYIATIYHLITKKQFEASTFVHSTLLTTCSTKEAMYKVVASIVATKSASQEVAKIITLLKPLIQETSKPTIDLAALENDPLEELPVTNPKPPSPQTSIPEEPVRVYTKNTGLVFLWPFLYDFFKVHNLMIGNQFSCDQAAHNAVYLLQYLITGKLKHPEWQLTLPKLLCGLSYDEILVPYRPIDDNHDTYAEEGIEQIEVESAKQSKETETIVTDESIVSSSMDSIASNSQLLIEKVIKRWESLTKLQEVEAYRDSTTTAILKNYFLNRQGVLTRQDDDAQGKFWHLTFMHQEHDNENLLPPWSMTNIKLPWMKETIILFWIPG